MKSNADLEEEKKRKKRHLDWLELKALKIPSPEKIREGELPGKGEQLFLSFTEGYIELLEILRDENEKLRSDLHSSKDEIEKKFQQNSPILTNIKQKQESALKLERQAKQRNIFNFPYKFWDKKEREGKNLIGLPLAISAIGFVFYYSSKREEVKELHDSKNNIIKDLENKFQQWSNNTYSLALWYVLIFYIFNDFYHEFLKKFLSNLAKDSKFDMPIVLVMALILGFLFILDGKITSSLKTPLQRLSIQIENSKINEKKKKSLLSKTQEANELMKETLKKFGILAIPPLLTSAVKDLWSSHPLNNFSYIIPMLYSWIIAKETERELKLGQ